MGLLLLWVVLGFVLLIAGAEWFVAGASDLARRYRVPNLVIGLTVVAFGTSAPEMAINMIAASEAKSDIVIANVIGSNLFNTLAILGVVGLVMPIQATKSTIRFEIPFSLAALILVGVLTYIWNATGENRLDLWDGAVLLVAFVLFLIYVVRSLKNESSNDQASRQQAPVSTGRTLLMMFAGLAGLLIGGQWVVAKATELAQILGVSNRIIGLTVVAVGTSLPELVTSLVAAIRNNSDIAIGNVLGSNIFNLLLVLSLSALIHPIDVRPAMQSDFLILGAGTLLLLILMLTRGKGKLDRLEALLLLSMYVGYTGYIILN